MVDRGNIPIAERIHSINEAIIAAAKRCGRDPASVRLLAVSKTMPVESLRLAIQAGVQTLGENYIQEARCKIDALTDFPVSWHFIGHLQTNKAKTAVALFNMIHTVDSLRIADELNKQAQKINKCQKILLQVNISGGTVKSGIAPEKTMALVKDISRLDHLSVRGLMTMPPYSNNPETARPFFKALFNLSQSINRAGIPGIFMEELSMGMTRDFEIAIEEGATLVRIGTAIFGSRK